MTGSQIIELYFLKSEQAIKETATRYERLYGTILQICAVAIRDFLHKRV